MAQATEFERRAAVALIRAADAGVIGADELDWLLSRLQTVKRRRDTGRSLRSGADADSRTSTRSR